MRRTLLLTISFLVGGALTAAAIPQIKSPHKLSPIDKESRGRNYRAVIVNGIETNAVRTSPANRFYSRAENLDNALLEWEAEGYEPDQITGVGDDSVLVLLKRIDDD